MTPEPTQRLPATPGVTVVLADGLWLIFDANGDIFVRAPAIFPGYYQVSPDAVNALVEGMDFRDDRLQARDGGAPGFLLPDPWTPPAPWEPEG